MNRDTISKRKVRRNDNRSGYNIFVKNNILKVQQRKMREDINSKGGERNMLNIKINGNESNIEEMDRKFKEEIYNENHTSIEKYCLEKVNDMLNTICRL